MSQPLSEFDASSEAKLSYMDSELAFANPSKSAWRIVLAKVT